MYNRGLPPRETYRLEGETQYPENTEIPSAEQNRAAKYGPAWGSANLFIKGQTVNISVLWPYGLCCSYSALPSSCRSGRGQYVNRWEQLFQ